MSDCAAARRLVAHDPLVPPLSGPWAGFLPFPGIGITPEPAESLSGPLFRPQGRAAWPPDGWQQCTGWRSGPPPETAQEFCRRALGMEPAEVVAAMSPTRAEATRRERQTSAYAPPVSPEVQQRVQALLIDVLAGPVESPGRPPGCTVTVQEIGESTGESGSEEKPLRRGFPDKPRSPVYRRRRLMADAPDLVEAVDAGVLSLHAAWKQHTGDRGSMSLNGTPEVLAARLRDRLGPELAAALHAALDPAQVYLAAVHAAAQAGDRSRLREAVVSARRAGVGGQKVAGAAGVSLRTVRAWSTGTAGPTEVSPPR